MRSSTFMFFAVVGLSENPHHYLCNICTHSYGGLSYFLSLSGYFGTCAIVYATYEYTIIGIIVVYPIE